LVWINWEIFAQEWLKRSRRKRKGYDEGDRFISLWIAFNGWMRGKYGESLTDAEQIQHVKGNQELIRTYDYLKETSPSFADLLNHIGRYSVANMRYPGDKNRILRYDGSFATLIDVLYSVRSNLFHGRKSIEENKKDFKLVVLSYKILRRLFSEYLKKKYAHHPFSFG